MNFNFCANPAFSALLMLVIGTGTACSLDPHGENAQLILRMEGEGPSSLASGKLIGGGLNTASVLEGITLPSSVDGFDCLFVNVMGPVIPSMMPDKIHEWEADYLNTSCAYPGIVSEPVSPLSPGEITLTVPTSPDVKVQVLGIKTQSGSCPADFRTLIEQESQNHFAAVELGATIIPFLTGSKSVEIDNIYDVNSPRGVKCGNGYNTGQLKQVLLAASVGTTPTPSKLTYLNIDPNSGGLFNHGNVSVPFFINSVATHPYLGVAYVVGKETSGSMHGFIYSYAFNAGGLIPTPLNSISIAMTSQYPTSVVVHPSGQWVYVGSLQATAPIRVYAVAPDGSLGALLQTYSPGAEYDVKFMSLSGDGTTLYVNFGMPTNRMTMIPVSSTTGQLGPPQVSLTIGASCASVTAPIISSVITSGNLYLPCNYPAQIPSITSFTSNISLMTLTENANYVVPSSSASINFTGSAGRYVSGGLAQIYVIEDNGGNSKLIGLDIASPGVVAAQANTVNMGYIPGGLAVDATARYLYVSYSASGTDHWVQPRDVSVGGQLPGTPGAALPIDSVGLLPGPVTIGRIIY